MNAPGPRARPGRRPRFGGRARLPAAGLAVLAAIVAIVVALSGQGSAAPHAVESMFQDDDHLLYAPPAMVTKVLDALAVLGVDRIRVTVLWRSIAPSPDAVTRPAGFDASNPGAYPAAGWAPYDRLVGLALAHRIAIDFNFTPPGPLWAMRRPAPDAKSADHYAPSAQEFGQFVVALGRRYSGTFVPAPGTPLAPGARSAPLPRVSYWSVWNEPNQPGWLAPQWGTFAGQRVMDSPGLYRDYVDAAWGALRATGHQTPGDTILIGELAPEGGTGSARYKDPIPPLPFVRALYCVDARYQPLRGQAAMVLHCPPDGSPAQFRAAHPGLFESTGFAHHPYSFFQPPRVQLPDPDFAPLANLKRLEDGLDRSFGAYGLSRQIPLYLTEYAYETNPPNPIRGVSLQRQAAYLNEAEYIAWKDPRVRVLSQFLLYDSPPDAHFPPGTIGYFSTFQTGLLFANGAPKPAFSSYVVPIDVPEPVFGPGSSVLVWGMLRAAPDNTLQHARIQWRPPAGAYRTLVTLSTKDPTGVLTAQVAPPGTGAVRIAWRTASGLTFYSRAVGVRSR